MKITIEIDTAEELSPTDLNLLALLSGTTVELTAVEERETEPAKPAKKAAPAKPKSKPEPEPEPEPEPMAEEPLPEDEDVVEDEEAEEDDVSDEDLLDRAVAKATDMVAKGQAAAVRAALEVAGASRVRELNKDNVRDFFKALP